MLLASRLLLAPSHCCHVPEVVGTVAGVLTAAILVLAVAGIRIVAGVLADDGGRPVSLFITIKVQGNNSLILYPLQVSDSDSILFLTMQRKIHLCIPFLGIARPPSQFTFMCLWAIYIFPGSVHIFSCSRTGRLIVGIYQSLTNTWMWKLGLRPRNSFCFEFSIWCLCSAS